MARSDKVFVAAGGMIAALGIAVDMAFGVGVWTARGILFLGCAVGVVAGWLVWCDRNAE
jgi:uncharacterized membrane protein SpoIIM required for sporulation